MQVGDVGSHTLAHQDMFVTRQIGAEYGPNRMVASNARLAAFVNPPLSVEAFPVYAFFPAALQGDISSAKVVEATKTGGRTFLLGEHASEQLGLPSSVYLDLNKLGWGEGHLEARLEVKGAGADFALTGIDPRRINKVLAADVDLRRTYDANRSPNGEPAILSSLAMIEGRNVGGQDGSYGRHAVNVSSQFLGQTKIKFVPTWLCVAHSSAIARHLAIVSKAIAPRRPLYLNPTVSEVRITPGTVRALYFDSATTDDELLILAKRVSTDANEVEEALGHMLTDAKHYLQLLSTTTTPLSVGGFSWVKIGDISLEFRRDARGLPRRAIQYKNGKSGAWYIAKDEIVVRRVGKFFADMESFRGGPSPYVAADEQELWFQHELFVLCVLRDHIRVCTQFALALRLQRGNKMSQNHRRAIEEEIVLKVRASVNDSPDLSLTLDRRTIEVAVRYRLLEGMTRSYRFLRSQAGERYRWFFGA